MALIIVNSILLLCADLILSVAVARRIDLRKILRHFTRWLTGNGDSRKMPGINMGYPDTDTAAGMNLLDRLELICIVKSNIRHYLPFMNIYILAGIMVMIFLTVYQPVNRLLKFLPSSAVISGMIAMVPFFAIDLLSGYNSETIRKMLSEYISVLNRWCSVKEDIMYAFEKSLDSNIGEPLQTFIKDMVIQVNRGLEPSEALDMLQMKVDNSQFRDFIVNIKLSLRNRGDIIKLLTNLENQFYKIDEEYNRRNISTYKDRMLIYVIMFAVLIVAYFFINFTPQINDFYLHTLEGKLLLTAFSGMYALGFYITAGIMKFRN